MSIPPINGSLLLSCPVVKTAVMSYPPSATHGGVSLQVPWCKFCLYNKPLMSALLSLGPFFSLGGWTTTRLEGLGDAAQQGPRSVSETRFSSNQVGMNK